MVDIISYAKVIEHERLLERLGDLRSVATTACREAPDLPASPVLVFTAATLLGDVYRLLSREPGARSLVRLDRRDRPSHRALVALLRDARLALDAFAWNHRDHDDDYGDEWLTFEGIEAFRDARRKVIPAY
ncbi:hypothetical protein [Devosia sp. SL43]|uniref:hypothetical protein n=1 Tax=Devosia sp. SL43 TaxID=2806348 RepID=UPI001F413A00|nr:hypothetical protein [Devosia sp. SL43]UJW86824.1 hypothetical protein IM737_06130 [Devosia sp. SL43]